MTTIGMNYHVREGKEEAFERMFARVIAALEVAPGHTRSNLFRDVNDPQSYLILSEWSDEGAFQQFIRSDEFRKVADWGSANILDRRPTHTVYRSE